MTMKDAHVGLYMWRREVNRLGKVLQRYQYFWIPVLQQTLLGGAGDGSIFNFGVVPVHLAGDLQISPNTRP